MQTAAEDDGKVNSFASIGQIEILEWHKIKSQAITEVVRMHPLGTMNIWIKFHGSLANSCQDISLKT